MASLAGCRPQLESRFFAPLPVPKQALDLIAQRLPFDVTGHGEDRSSRLEESTKMIPDSRGRQPFNPFRRPATVVAQRWRIVQFLQLNEHLLARIVFQALQILKPEGN